MFIVNENAWINRWSNEQIRAMLIEQYESFCRRDIGIERARLKDIQKTVSLPHAVIVFGLRRVGKSTLLAQLARQIGLDTFYYINFEDERLIGFKAEDANDLYQKLVEVFGDRKIFIMDEIQNVPGWEHFVRRFMDMGFKFYISGSNASLLSRELGTRLTGRYVPIELFPFSFQEYLRFREIPISPLHRATTLEMAELNRAFRSYLDDGGIPDALKYPELPILRTLYEDVLYRDIAIRHRLTAITALRELAYFAVSHPAELISYNKLKDTLRLGSVNTVSSYIEYLENSWLILTVNRYAYSVKQQKIAPKKVYCIDTGLVNSVGFHFSPNIGKRMENAVFLALRQKTHHIYYYTTKRDYEVDFYLPETRQLIQVSQRFENSSTREREFRAIVEAARELNVDSALILSEAEKADTTAGDVPVEIHPLTAWLLKQ